MALMSRKNPVSPERTALALALERAKAARVARDAAIAAEGPANDAVKACRERVEAAETAIETTKTEAGRRAAVSLTDGDIIEAPVALRQARARLIEAEDDLSVALAARDSLNARQSTDGAAVSFSDAKVKAAVAAVIRSEVVPSPEALAAEIVATQKLLADKVSALNWLINNARALKRVEEPGSYFGQPADEALRAALFRMGDGNIPLWGERWSNMIDASPAAAALRAAAAELERNAGARVPAIGD